MIVRIIYNFLLSLFLIIFFPRIFQKKFRLSLKERLGLKVPDLKSSSSNRIWVHAVSVGEAKAVFPLVRRLREDHPDAFIVFTTTTATGLKEVNRGCSEADVRFLMPFDLFIRKWVKLMNPTLVILSETDFWFNFLDASKKQGAKIVLVNGKISSRSFKRYQYVSRIFSLLDKFIVQATIYKDRFLKLGIPASKIVISGNLKLDKLFDEKVLIEPSRPTLVIGSTHHPEEKLFLEILKDLWVNYPDLQAYLVPRHPERFDKVAKLIDSFGISCVRSSKSGLSNDASLILVDEMGKLDALYKNATIAAVGGSWTEKVGGHNIFEPSFYKKPVIFGPYMQAQPDFAEEMLEAEGGVQVDSTGLKGTLEFLIQNPFQAKAMGKNGYNCVKESAGALDKTLKEITEKLVKT